MIRRPPRSTRTYTLFPYPTLFRSHNLEDAGALAAPGRIFGGLPKLVEQDLDDAFKLALLGGRKMIDVGSHQTLSSAEMAARQPDLPRFNGLCGTESLRHIAAHRR